MNGTLHLVRCGMRYSQISNKVIVLRSLAVLAVLTSAACASGSPTSTRDVPFAQPKSESRLVAPPPLTRSAYERHAYGTVNVESDVSGPSKERGVDNTASNSRLGTIQVTLNDSSTPSLIASGMSIVPSFVPNSNDGGDLYLTAPRSNCLQVYVSYSAELGNKLIIRCVSPYQVGAQYNLSDSSFLAKYQSQAIINQSHVVYAELMVDASGTGHAFLYNYSTSQWDLAYSNAGIASGALASTQIDEGGVNTIGSPCPSRPEFLHWGTTIDDGAGNTRGLGLSDATVSGPAPLTSCWSTSGRLVTPYYQSTFPNSDYTEWYVDQL
jgi:hypothetical protein